MAAVKGAAPAEGKKVAQAYAAPESSTGKMVFLMVGVWVSFTVFGWATEALTSKPYGSANEKFHFTWSLVLLQSVGNSIVGAAMIYITGAGSLTGGVPAKDWLIAGGAYLGAHKFGLLSLGYIIFPMQVLVKSCKAIPVMFGEVLFEREVKITTGKLVSVAMLCAGVVVFTFGKGSKKGEKFELDDKMITGLFFVLLALLCDGVYGPYQNRIKTKAKAAGNHITGYHNMFNMNIWQGVLALGFCLFYGELAKLADFVARNPSVLPDLAKFTLAMAVGNLFIFQLQSSAGALAVTKTTTVRKLISVLFSVWYFGHSMMPLQWAGVAMVFLSEPVNMMISGGKAKAH